MLLGKKRKDNQIFIVLSQEDEIFKLPEIENDKTQKFNSQGKLERDEWFYIDLSNRLEIIKPFIYKDTSGFNNLDGENLSDINCLFEKQKGNYLFQRITPKKIIQKKTNILLNLKVNLNFKKLKTLFFLKKK